MTVYVIADINVTDDGWVPAYAASVHDIVHKHGGKYLSRSGNVKTLEGKPLDTTFISLLKNLNSSGQRICFRFSSSYKRSVRFGSECSRLVATLSL